MVWLVHLIVPWLQKSSLTSASAPSGYHFFWMDHLHNQVYHTWRKQNIRRQRKSKVCTKLQGKDGSVLTSLLLWFPNQYNIWYFKGENDNWVLEWERKLTSCNQRACYLACLLWLPSLREDTSKISQKLLTLKSAKHYLNSLSLQKINQKSPGNNSFKTRGLIVVAIRGLQSKKYGNMQNTATQHSWKIKKHGGDTTIN